MGAEVHKLGEQQCSPAATPSQDLKQQSTELNRILWKARLHGDSVSAWAARFSTEMLEPRGCEFDWACALIARGRMLRGDAAFALSLAQIFTVV